MKIRFSLALTGVAACLVFAQEPSKVVAAAGERIDLRVLYAGHPKSAREKDFVRFLEGHFATVGREDLKGFTEKKADGYDVVILDYDGQGFNAPKPSIGRDYARATVTVGVAGANIGDRLGLKTGYL